MLWRGVMVGCLVLVVAGGAALLMFGGSDESRVRLVQPAGKAGCVAATGTGACMSASAILMPQALAVSPDAKHLYVASLSAELGGVAVFVRDAATGTLAQRRGRAGCISEARGPCRHANAMKGARDLAISPDGRNVYVAALSSDAIAVLDRDRVTGALTQKRGRAGCISRSGSQGACVKGRALDALVGIEVSPDGRSVYATSYGDNAVAVFDRSPSSGALQQKRGRAGCLVGEGSRARPCGRAPVDIGPESDVAVSPDSRHVYTNVVFDRAASGALTVKRGDRAIGPGGSIRFSADGKHAYDASGQVYARHPTTGAVTPKACFQPRAEAGCTAADGVADAFDLALSPDGRSVYVVSSDGEGDAVLGIFDRDPANGELTQRSRPEACVSNAGSGGCARGRLPVYSGALSVVVGPDNRSVYVAGDTISVFRRG